MRNPIYITILALGFVGFAGAIAVHTAQKANPEIEAGISQIDQAADMAGDCALTMLQQGPQASWESIECDEAKQAMDRVIANGKHLVALLKTGTASENARYAESGRRLAQNIKSMTDALNVAD